MLIVRTIDKLPEKLVKIFSSMKVLHTISLNYYNENLIYKKI